MIENKDIKSCNKCGICYDRTSIKVIERNGSEYEVCPVCNNWNILIGDVVID